MTETLGSSLIEAPAHCGVVTDWRDALQVRKIVMRLRLQWSRLHEPKETGNNVLLEVTCCYVWQVNSLITIKAVNEHVTNNAQSTLFAKRPAATHRNARQ